MKLKKNKIINFIKKCLIKNYFLNIFKKYILNFFKELREKHDFLNKKKNKTFLNFEQS